MTQPASVAASATVRKSCASPEEAEALLRALSPDNSTFVTGRTEGRVLVLSARASSVGELQRTLDDTLACLSAAERVGAPHRPSAGRSSTPPEITGGGADDEGEEEEEA